MKKRRDQRQIFESNKELEKHLVVKKYLPLTSFLKLNNICNFRINDLERGVQLLNPLKSKFPPNININTRKLTHQTDLVHHDPQTFLCPYLRYNYQKQLLHQRNVRLKKNHVNGTLTVARAFSLSSAAAPDREDCGHRKRIQIRKQQENPASEKL